MNKPFSKNQVNFYTVTEKDENQRLDNLLMKLLQDVPKAHLYRIIRGGEVRVNKKRAEVSHKVQLNDLIRVPPIVAKAATPNTAYIPKATFPIIYEDNYYLIINKPDGVACHGGSGVSFGVIEQLRQNYPQAKFLELVHRLDRDTSGILILAKKRLALVELQELIKNGEIKKHYLAMTCGVWQDKLRNVKVPLLKYLTKDGERRVRVEPEQGKYSHTVFSVVEKFTDYTLVKADIKTGRTHQIRVHLQHIGYPIIGDIKYGNFEINRELVKAGFKRMFLHAHMIEFIHPMTQEKIRLLAELPPNLQVFVDKLKHESLAVKV